MPKRKTRLKHRGRPVYKITGGNGPTRHAVQLKSGRLKFLSKESVRRLKGKSGSKKKKRRSSSSKRSSGKRKTMAKRPLSLSSAAALVGPMLIAGDRATDAGGTFGEQLRRGSAEYLSFYTGYNFEDNDFNVGNLGVGWGFFAASKAVKHVKRQMGNPSIPGGMVTF